MELLTDPAVWASFATLVVLEIVLGVDNIIFISIVANRLPPGEREKAIRWGLTGALVLRILLLLSIAWIVSLTQPVVTLLGFDLSWRDIILLSGGLFLIYKAVTEIHAEVEGGHGDHNIAGAVTFNAIFAQIIVLDLVFSLDSVITAVGVADHVEVMIAAVIIAIMVMMTAARPIADFVHKHPSTKMLALAFLVMIGMALMADGLHYHVDRGFIYAAMIFGGAVEVLNLWRGKRGNKTPPPGLADARDNPAQSPQRATAPSSGSSQTGASLMSEPADAKSDMERLNADVARYGAGYAVMRGALAGRGIDRVTQVVSWFLVASAVFVVGAAVYAAALT